MSRVAGVAAAVTVSVALLSTGCAKDQPLQAPPVGAPTYLISDGAHSGNSSFFFLPPLVPSPNAFFHPGTFNAGLSPAVDVCVLDHDPRLLPPTPPATCVVSQFGPATLALDLANQQYTRNWDTKAPPGLDASKFYRIQVRGAPQGTVLGFLDVDPVDQGVKNLRTGDVVQFQDGRTLPIAVRIEQGAFGTTNPDHVEQTVGNVATIVTTNTGFAGASFPDNWLPLSAVQAGVTQVVLTIERIPVGEGTRDPTCFQSGRVQYEGCYRFTTDPDLHQFDEPFANPVIVGVCIQRPDFEDTNEPVEMFRQEEAVSEPALTELQSVAAPFLTCDGFTETRVGSLRSGSLLDLASAGVRSLGRGIARLVTPGPLYAVDFGAGGSTDGFSRFGWARTGIAPATLINCTGDPGGDQTFRGFYVPSYPGTLLDQVTLHLSSGTAGTYTMALTAHSSGYNGPIIAFDSETVTLTANDQVNVATTFTFPSAPVTAGSTVAFSIQKIAGPNAVVFYSVPVDDPTCAVVQTEDTSGTLSTFRRHGVNVQIQGAGPIIR